MIHNKIKFILTFLLITAFGYADWETIGGNSQRTSFLDVVGPESKYDILWEGSIPSDGGWPILISGNKLIVNRKRDSAYSPIVCHDLFNGDTLWTLDFPGGYHSYSIPLGFRNNVVYASNWFGDLVNGDTLYAINAENGEIIWRSNVFILGDYDLGAVFSEKGDLILSTPDSVTRINHLNGRRIWCIKRSVPVVSSYNGLTVFKDKIYGWFLGPLNTLQIISISIDNGDIKDCIDIPSTNPPVSLLTGPLISVDDNGIIYALRAEDNLVAIKDNNDKLSILWNIPIRNGGDTNPALGPEGSIYFINHNKIMRANTENGKIIDSSITVNADTSKYLNGYFAIDGKGTVFFNNHNYDYGKLYSFSENLELNWTDHIKGIGHGGPALSKHGLLAIAGADNFLRVYKPVNLKSNNLSMHYKNTTVSCSVFPQCIAFNYYVKYNSNVRLLLYNSKGQEIYNLTNLPNTPGFNTMKITNSNFNFCNGIYLLKLNIGAETKTGTFTIIK